MMGNFSRKLKRKQMLIARKKLFKDFKAQMAKFKKQVKCSKCERLPEANENIDNWHIDQESNNIDLVCPQCYDVGGVGESSDEI